MRIKVIFYWKGAGESYSLDTDIQVKDQVQLGAVLETMFEIYPMLTMQLPGQRDNDSLSAVLDVQVNGGLASLNSYVVNGDVVTFEILGG